MREIDRGRAKIDVLRWLLHSRAAEEGDQERSGGGDPIDVLDLTSEAEIAGWILGAAERGDIHDALRGTGLLAEWCLGNDDLVTAQRLAAHGLKRAEAEGCLLVAGDLSWTLAISHLGLGENDEYERWAGRAIRLHGGNPDAARQIQLIREHGEYLLGCERWEEAIRMFESALERLDDAQPSVEVLAQKVWIRHRLSYCEEQAGKLAEAVADCWRAIILEAELDPEGTSNWIMIRLLMRTGLASAASALLAQSKPARPHERLLHRAAAIYLGAEGGGPVDRREVEAFVASLAGIDDPHVLSEVWYWVGLAFAIEGATRSGLEYLGRAMEVAPLGAGKRDALVAIEAVLRVEEEGGPFVLPGWKADLMTHPRLSGLFASTAAMVH